MLKCREISRIVAADGTDDLGFMRRLELRMHMIMCVHCRNYLKQIRALGAEARRLAAGGEPSSQELEKLERDICDQIINHGNGG